MAHQTDRRHHRSTLSDLVSKQTANFQSNPHGDSKQGRLNCKRPSSSPARIFVPRRERVYIIARACELELGGTKGLQAAGAGGRSMAVIFSSILLLVVGISLLLAAEGHHP